MRRKLTWWLRPVRMMRRDYIGDFAQFMRSDLDQLGRESLKRRHINCEWIMATPGCSPGLGYLMLFNTSKFEKFPGIGDFDMLRSYLPYARKRGLRLVAYLNLHWYSYDFAAQHPGWEQLLEDGTPYGRKAPLYGDGTTFCVNSPWRDWALDMIKEVMRTGVDGCFLDGPVVYPGACYCQSCRRLFTQETGQSRMPSYGDWANPIWKRFAQFRAQSWANFLRDAQAGALEVNRKAVIFLNGGGYGTEALATARDAYGMEKFQTFTGAEQFYHCTGQYDSPYKSLNLARFLAAGEKPAIVFTHHTLSTWHYLPLPKSEMAAALAQTVAGGANTWFAIFMEAMKSRADEAIEAAARITEFLEKNEEYYTATASAADTAVLFSNRTLCYYISTHREITRYAGSGREANLIADSGSDRMGKDLASRRAASADILDHEYPGCLDAFNFGHVPVRVLWDEHLTPSKLRGIRTLVLPAAACLSDEQIEAIRSFVQAGGGLLATFESGFYDEWGDPAERSEWMRFLGIERVEGVFAPSRTEDYMTVASDQVPGFPTGLLLPRPLHALKIVPVSDAESLIFYCNPVGKSYLSMKGISPYPAAIFARRGRGRVVYCASPLFESFDRFHIADHRALAVAFVRLAAGGAGLQLQTDAPGSLAVEMRAQRGRLIVHLVNVTSEMKRPMERIIPLHDVKISIRAKAARRARCLWSGKALRLHRDGDRVTFQVPVVREYEVVILD